MLGDRADVTDEAPGGGALVDRQPAAVPADDLGTAKGTRHGNAAVEALERTRRVPLQGSDGGRAMRAR